MADRLPDVSVLFADLVGFTAIAARLTPDALVAVLDELFGRFDDIGMGHGAGEDQDHRRWVHMAVAGANGSASDHAPRAVATGAVQISAQTASALDSDFRIEPVGHIDVRGKGRMKAFRVRPARAGDTRKHPEEPSGS